MKINEEIGYINALLRFIPEDILDRKTGKTYQFKIWKHQNRLYAGFPPFIMGQTSDKETNDLSEPLEKLFELLKVKKLI